MNLLKPYIRQNVPLSELTTFAVGGPARYLGEPSTLEELKWLIEQAGQEQINIYPLGGGSNILASDRGFEGLLIRPKFNEITIEDHPQGYAMVKAQAGVIWDDLVAACVERNLAGLECLSGIPGFVGASPVQNIGAYGQEAASAIFSVEALDCQNLKIEEIANSDCGFSYRTSNFKSHWPGRYFITAVNFKLKKGAPASVRYGDLTRYFKERGLDHPDYTPSLSQVRQAVLEVRHHKNMSLSEDNPNRRCAGSFYLNPIVEEELAEDLLKQYPQMPTYPTVPGHTKLSAAWLVENAGFPKGYRWGGAGLSSRHVLAVINAERATAQEIMELSEQIVGKVAETFAVALVPEPNLLGF